MTVRKPPTAAAYKRIVKAHHNAVAYVRAKEAEVWTLKCNLERVDRRCKELEKENVGYIAKLKGVTPEKLMATDARLLAWNKTLEDYETQVKYLRDNLVYWKEKAESLAKEIERLNALGFGPWNFEARELSAKLSRSYVPS